MESVGDYHASASAINQMVEKILMNFFCDGKGKRKRLPSELFRANNLETFSRSRKEGASFMASIQVKLRACTQLLSRDSWPRGSMI